MGPFVSLTRMEPRRIAVLRALYLGDMLCAVPAFRALRRAFPSAEVTLIGLPWARAFARRFSEYIDDFIPLPGEPGSEALARFRWPEVATREPGFDLAVQLHGDGRYSNALAGSLGAGVTAGSYQPEAGPQPGPLFRRYAAEGSEIERSLGVLTQLGLPGGETSLEFPIAPAEDAEAELLLEDHGLDGDIVCVHPGARLHSRRWPAQRFAAVADALARQGLRVVITGSEEERSLTNEVESGMCCDAAELAGQTSLGALAAIVKRAKLAVTNDTGMSHIAAAVKTPSVVVACGSDVARWAPLDRELHRVLAQDIDCRPCGHDICPIGHPCAEAIEPDEVIEACNELLRRYAS